METRESIIKHTIQEFIRVSKLYSRIEELPLPVEDGVEITTREAHIIQAIGDHDRMSVTQVASHFGITKSGASQMVSKLVKRGFLHKKQAAHSNKEFELSLTALGDKAFQAHEQLHGKDLAGLVDRLSDFPPSHIETMSVLLEALGKVMEQRLSQRFED